MKRNELSRYIGEANLKKIGMIALMGKPKAAAALIGAYAAEYDTRQQLLANRAYEAAFDARVKLLAKQAFDAANPDPRQFISNVNTFKGNYE